MDLPVNNKSFFLKIISSPATFLYMIVDYFLSIIVYSFKGVLYLSKNSSYFFYYLWEICQYSLIGMKIVFVDSPKLIYFVLSGKVDKTYKVTKGAVNEVAKKPSKFKEMLLNKYNELGFVKENKLKLEKERIELLESLNTLDAKRLTKATVYRYLVKNQDDKFIKGTFTGFSKLDVNSFLVNEGYTVYKIETSGMINFLYGSSSFGARKLSNKDLIFWLTQLSTYIKSGIPLTETVRIISAQMGKKNRQKRIYESIVYELNMGENFSTALEKQGTIFPTLLINMLKAAEATGDLVETLEDMATYYTETEKTKKQIISAMTYPSIIMIFAVGVITFIMLFIIPEFTKVYDSIDVEINGLTKSIINISDFLQSNITNIVLIFIMIFIVTFMIFKKVKAFRLIIQSFLMKLPVIGKIIIYKEITIFTKTFSSLLKNNVFITESIDILSKITNNEIYKEIMFTTISNVVKGDKISLAFKDHWAVPELAYHMIITGESTGQLPIMMARVSDYFQEMNRNSVNSLKSLIEPIMIVSLAIVVGIVILAVIMPMFGLYDTLPM